MENVELVKSLVAMGGVVMIIGLVQIIKPWVSETRLYPLFGVFFGLILNLGATIVLGQIAPVDWFASSANGIIAGLAASGLYEVAVAK